MMFCTPLRAIVSLVLVVGVALPASAQKLAAAEPEARPNAAATPAMNPRELPQIRSQLLQKKRVGQWPAKLGGPGGIVVELSVTECTWLGGSVVFHAGCGTTLMKCVAPNGHEMCIDEIK